MKLNETVLSSIVKTAACKTPVVIRISTGSNLFENVADLIGHNKARENAIKIEMAEEKINIAIRIIVIYGKNVPQLAKEVQLNIIQRIKEFTGLETGKVDVIVNGVEEHEEENNN